MVIPSQSGSSSGSDPGGDGVYLQAGAGVVLFL
jgi:hypothetical protein